MVHTKECNTLNICVYLKKTTIISQGNYLILVMSLALYQKTVTTQQSLLSSFQLLFMANSFSCILFIAIVNIRCFTKSHNRNNIKALKETEKWSLRQNKEIFSVNTREESFKDEIGTELNITEKAKERFGFKKEGAGTIKSMLTFWKQVQP